MNYKVFIKKLILILSEKSVKVLSNPEVSRLSFEDYKKMVIELNNILMKINISVNPYLLIKMIILSYIENAKLNNNIEFLYDWWEGQKYIKLFGIESVSNLKIDGE